MAHFFLRSLLHITESCYTSAFANNLAFNKNGKPRVKSGLSVKLARQVRLVSIVISNALGAVREFLVS
jgi:hypothetical protein